MFDRLLGWYTIYTFFWGGHAPNGILSDATFTLRPSLAFSYIGSATMFGRLLGWYTTHDVALVRI